MGTSMNNDELMQLAEMFDSIVNSDNPAVQRSLQYTAVLAKLAEEKQNTEQGPFLKMFSMMHELRTEVASLRRSVQILENNSGSYTNIWNTSVVDLNMNSGPSALTTVQISALTGEDTFTIDPISVSDITIDFNDYSSNNKIKF
jgi:hypothetical protein